MEPWKALEKPGHATDSGFRIGPSGIFVEEWSGRFYPPGLPKDKWVEFYEAYFSFTEIDCYLRHYPRNFFSDMARKTRGPLMFGVRVPKEIATPSEPARGKDRLNHLLESIGPLVEDARLYSLLFQIGANIPRSLQNLEYFLEVAMVALRHRLPVHFEFRNRSWHCAEVLSKMRDWGVGICNAELGDKYAFPFRSYATTERGYIRYLGKRFICKKPGWKPTQKEREDQKTALFDYLYSEGEVEGHIGIQFELQRKTSQVAVVYANSPRAQAVANAIQNARQTRTRLEIQRLCAQKPKTGPAKGKEKRAPKNGAHENKAEGSL